MKSLSVFFIFFISYSFSQTFSDDVAQLFYNNCTTCHNPNGIGPFSIMTYEDVTVNAGMIYDAIAQDQMPPWPPQESYVSFAHSRTLTENEKTTMLDWLTNGMPEGNPANTPAPPVFNSGSLLGAGDLEIQMPSYMSKASSGQDDYVCFSMPTGLLANRSIKAMEVVPGNPEIVHHCLVYIDETGAYPTDSTSGTCNGPTTNSTLVGGYTPGSTPLIFPNNGGLKLGMDIPANSNIVFALHYPEGSYGQFDSTKVIFHFYPNGETGIRQVSAAPIIQNWSFVLPPEQFTSVNGSYANIPVNISLLSVFPHMHLLGKSIKSYALAPTNDTIRFINIPDWDFHWQDFYMFKNMVKIPPGSTIKGEGVYDNTSANPHNPTLPPQTVYPGLNTLDEMFLIYFHYLPYVNGDELYDIEELTSLSLADFDIPEKGEIDIYPNPMSDQLSIAIEGTQNLNTVSVSIYDLKGSLVKKIAQGKSFTDELIIPWDGHNENGVSVQKGAYYVSILLNQQHFYKKLIKE